MVRRQRARGAVGSGLYCGFLGRKDREGRVSSQMGWLGSCSRLWGIGAVLVIWCLALGRLGQVDSG